MARKKKLSEFVQSITEPFVKPDGRKKRKYTRRKLKTETSPQPTAPIDELRNATPGIPFYSTTPEDVIRANAFTHRIGCMIESCLVVTEGSNPIAERILKITTYNLK